MLGLWSTGSRLPALASARLANRVSRVSQVRALAAVSNASEPGVADPSAYCRDYVRKRDYESYLIGSFYPREHQSAFYALRAFYVSLRSCPRPFLSSGHSVTEEAVCLCGQRSLRRVLACSRLWSEPRCCEWNEVLVSRRQRLLLSCLLCIRRVKPVASGRVLIN